MTAETKRNMIFGIPLSVIGTLLLYSASALLWGKGIDARVETVECRQKEDRQENKAGFERIENKLDKVYERLMKRN